MKNSVLPLMLLVATAAGAAWLVRGGAAQGQDGPDNQQGIFRIAKHEGRRIQPAAVPGTVVLHGDLPAVGSGIVLQITGDDRHGLTRSICRSFAELMTERGLIAVLEPAALPGKETEPLPLPCDGAVHVATEGFTPPTEPGLPLKALVTITVRGLQLPAEHPAARLLPRDALGAAPHTVTLELDLGAAPGVAWPAWWSGVGRKAAVALAAALRLPEHGDVSAHVRRGAWLAPTQAVGPGSEGVPPVSEHGRLPSPPQHDVVTELLPFSEPLVRGWVGRLATVPIATHDGGTRTPRDELVRRLTKGLWVPGPAHAERDVFTRETDGMATSISVERDGTVVVWQERPSPAAVVQAWLAVPTDALAREQLQRHRGVAGVPAGLIP